MVRPLQAVKVPVVDAVASPATVPADARSLGLLAAIAVGGVGVRLLPLDSDPRVHSALAIGLFMIVARVVIMAAIAMGLVEAFGVAKGSNIARGMFIILVYQATIFDKMLIAGASSIAARGAIEKFGQIEVLWSQWFLAYLPCDLIVMIVAWRL